MMDEYVVLAVKEWNPNDPESETSEWTVGTREQAVYWMNKWEEQGYMVHVRRCGHTLNADFIKAGLNHRGEPV